MKQKDTMSLEPNDAIKVCCDWLVGWLVASLSWFLDFFLAELAGS